MGEDRGNIKSFFSFPLFFFFTKGCQQFTGLLRSNYGPILKLVTLRENRIFANNRFSVSCKVIQLFSVFAGGRK